jgi:outer membrane scaffolding protein for murein synthesis (MipA/OmpV family)
MLRPSSWLRGGTCGYGWALDRWTRNRLCLRIIGNTMPHRHAVRRIASVLAAALIATPALALEGPIDAPERPADAPAPEQAAAPGPPRGDDTMPGPPQTTPVFDDTWATIGIGAGLVPSYSGSDDYRLFPLPLIVGRVGGVGITPNGPGFSLDLLSKGPRRGPPAPAKASVSFGPAFRLRNDRDGQIGDDVVALAGELETAIELGVQGGVRIPGVLSNFDAVTFSAQARWDVLGAHKGMLIEPGITYFTPVGRGAAIQLSATASFVDDDFADYYYTVTPAQNAATGLLPFAANGGLNSVGALTIVTVDLDGNILNGGFNIYGVAGYSRLVGDAADSPFSATRGSANQIIAGLGVGYTF